MNDSRTRQVSVAPVIVRAPAGRALTGGSPEPGAGGVPPAVVSVHGPAGACGGAAKRPGGGDGRERAARELDLQPPLRSSWWRRTARLAPVRFERDAGGGRERRDGEREHRGAAAAEQRGDARARAELEPRASRA